jgi:hypothetical protein
MGLCNCSQGMLEATLACRGEEGVLPRAFRGKVVLPTPWFQTSPPELYNNIQNPDPRACVTFPKSPKLSEPHIFLYVTLNHF